MPYLPQLEPNDEHNQRLEAQVHPRDWTNPTPDQPYNLVVIGAGTAGLVTAAGAAGLGARVALVERELMGGDCLNVGCVPSKALISAARIAGQVRSGRDFGIHTTEPASVDFPAVMERMRRLRATISPNDSAQRFRQLGVDVYFGSGRFVDSNVVDVDGLRLRFKKAIIATGARASAPPIPGLASIPYLTNESLFSLTQRPDRFGVIGAGPIGCEMAQAFALLGARVVLVETAHGVLPREDREAAEVVRLRLERDGVALLCCGQDVRVSQDSHIRLRVCSHGEEHEHELDQLLVAVGRTPNVEGLNLDAVGVSFDNQGVHVDDFLRTTNSNVLAAGDICSPYRFTHAADFMARIAIQNALFPKKRRVSRLIIPWCTYTTPELAHVGLLPSQAEQQGIACDTFVQPLKDVDRAVLEGDEEGFVKVHVRKGKDRLLGATIVARNAGDLISEVTLAMTHGLGLSAIGSTIHPYPTQAEAIRRLGDQYNRTRVSPLIKTVLDKWMRWLRR